MLFKLLSELTVRELRTVFRRSGKRGIFQESNAIVQLTVYLFRIGQDPFTYRFPISGTEDNVEATLVKEAEDDAVQEGIDDVPHNATNCDAIGIAESVSAKHMSDDRQLENIENVDDISVDRPESGSEEILAISCYEFADGGLADSAIAPVSVSSVSSPSLLPVPFSFIGSRVTLVSSRKASSLPSPGHSSISSESSFCMEMSNRSIMVDEDVDMSGRELSFLVMNLHPELWPTDMF